MVFSGRKALRMDRKIISLTIRTRLYLVDKSGNLRVTYFVDVTVSDLVSDIKYLIEKSG